MRGGSDLAQFGHNEARAWDADDFEAPARGVGRAFKRAHDLLQNIGIGIVGAGRGLANDARRSDETREHVDMPIGVIVAKAALEPDDLPRAEGLAQRRLGLPLRSEERRVGKACRSRWRAYSERETKTS